MKARLVLIETGGNQDFIFSTNKLRQNIGASELIHRIGTGFVLEAVRAKVPAYDAPLQCRKDTSHYVAELDRVASENPLGPSVPVEVLVATSGKAVLLVADEATGEDIIKDVTLKALQKAPGAIVRGIVDSAWIKLGTSSSEQGASRADAHARMKAVHEGINALRLDLPAPEARFPVLPITALCQTSGLPVEHRIPYPARDGEPARVDALSEPAFIKQCAADDGWKRVQSTLGDIGEELAKDIERLERMDLGWLGVVHADGNGFGKVFLKLAACMPDDVSAFTKDDPRGARAYCTFYRKLSLALDLAGLAALRDAIPTLAPMRLKSKKSEKKDDTEDVAQESFRPIVPLVLGGDDLTVICDGRQAVRFARRYLKALEDATRQPYLGEFRSVIPALIDRDKETDPSERTKLFGGGAGIAIVKPHHPFHRAYGLAEDLIRSAKSTKTRLGDAVSALDFQVVYQDAADDLDRLRADWKLEDPAPHGSGTPADDRRREQEASTETWLHARPYVVSRPEIFVSAGEESRRWAVRHHIATLIRAIATLPPTDEGETALSDDRNPRGLPRSQQHALRSALFQGRVIANARFALVRQRYTRVDWNVLGDESMAAGQVDSLFFPEATRDNKQTFRTRLLDALDLIDIGETFQDEAPEPGALPGAVPGASS